jgi:hypothetical protein
MATTLNVAHTTTFQCSSRVTCSNLSILVCARYGAIYISKLCISIIQTAIRNLATGNSSVSSHVGRRAATVKETGSSEFSPLYCSHAHSLSAPSGNALMMVSHLWRNLQTPITLPHKYLEGTHRHSRAGKRPDVDRRDSDQQSLSIRRWKV